MNRSELAIDYPTNVFDKVVEEAGEVLQAIGKYKRFGPYNHNPCAERMIQNWDQLSIEIGDLQSALSDLDEYLYELHKDG